MYGEDILKPTEMSEINHDNATISGDETENAVGSDTVISQSLDSLLLLQ